MKRLFLYLLVLSALGGCATTQQYGSKTLEDEGHPPVIVDYWAAKAIRPGTTWRIYLQAQDQGGDMNRIACMLYQSGIGYYSTEFTRIKEEDRAEFAGYLILRTPAMNELLLEELTMEILIRDRKENRSKTIKLPLSFKYVESEEIPGKWQDAAKHQLDIIKIDIEPKEFRHRKEP